MLLAALALALAKWTGRARHVVEIESQGRDAPINLDVSRTVGWFTTVYPVLLDAPDGETAQGVLRRIRETLRGVPNKGLGYGLLRHVEQVAGLPEAEIGFNYLGKLDATAQTLERVILEEVIALGPMLHAPEGERRHLIEIQCVFAAGHLHADFGYSERIHTRAEIEKLAHAFERALAQLIAGSVDAMGASTAAPTAVLSATPALAEFDWSDSEIDELAQRIQALTKRIE